jgi:hypothetical protein
MTLYAGLMITFPSITITTQIYERLGAATDSKLDVAALSESPSPHSTSCAAPR